VSSAVYLRIICLALWLSIDSCWRVAGRGRRLLRIDVKVEISKEFKKAPPGHPAAGLLVQVPIRFVC